MSLFRTSLATTCAAALVAGSLATAPTRVAANDFLEGVAGALIGAAIANEVNKKKSKPKTVTRTVSKPKPAGPRPTIAVFATTRTEVRDYQTRLNTLGYNAGAPDGIYGGKTKRAVMAFQTSIGAAATGVLSQADASILIASKVRRKGGR